MVKLFTLFFMFIAALANDTTSETFEDNTDEITIIVMSVVFGSVILVSLFVAVVLCIQQKKRKTEEYSAL